MFHTNTTTRRPGDLASRVNGATAQANSDYTLFRRPKRGGAASQPVRRKGVAGLRGGGERIDALRGKTLLREPDAREVAGNFLR